MQPSLRLSFCGVPTLTLHEQALAGLLTGKPLALFIYLATNPRPHRRDDLAQLFWHELSNQQARNNLRYVLPDLRRVLGDYLTITPEQIGFNRQQPYWSDVEILQHTLMKKESEVSLADLESALTLYQGEFLAGFSVNNAQLFEAWVVRQREELHSLVLLGLVRLSNCYYQQEDYPAGLTTTQRLLQWEPWHEPAHRLRMKLLVASGQRSAALAQYALCREILLEELGAEPEPATTALYEQIRMGKLPEKKTPKHRYTESAEANLSLFPGRDAGQSLDFSIPKASPSRMNNLPGQLTSFIGRKVEVEALTTLLCDSAQRLLTLTGLGGSGKTRLALASAARCLEVTASCPSSFPDGIWFVPLIGITADDNLADTLAVAIADALRLSRTGPVAPGEQLLEALQTRQLLLILDNFEHVVEGRDFIQTLLQRAGGVKLVVTSRRPLTLPTEYVWQVGGLTVPPLNQEFASASEVTQKFDAVKLFVERAQCSNPEFRLDKKNLLPILSICNFVEGLPLAIELAAALTRYYTGSMLWETLQQDLRVLAVTQRDLAPRHRTIAAMLDDSWRLLTPSQVQVLAACSLFPQAFTAAAAAAIAAATPETLAALVAHSLLQKTANGGFKLHPLTRQYASDQLQRDPQAVALYHRRHADYYSNLAETDAGSHR